MANIAQLAVSVVAKTIGFDSKMEKSRKKVRSFSKDVKASKKQLVAMGKAAAAAVGIGGVGLFLKSQLDTLDNLGKTADKLGLTTEKLGAYRFAAKLSGVETKALDTAIQRMARRVSEAAIGTGEAQKALKELNLDAEKLNRLGPQHTFEAIARSINKIQGQGDKIRIASKIFDTEGVGLVNTFSQNLGEVERKFAALGGVPSREGIKQVEKFNDAMESLKTSIGAIGQKFVIAIAPQATEFVDKLTKWTSDIKNSTVGKIFEGISREFTAQDGLFKFKERRNPFTGKTSKTTGSIILDTLFHDSGMRNVERHFKSKGNFQAAPAHVLQRQQELGVWLPPMLETLKSIDRKTSPSNDGPILQPSAIQ